MIIHCSVFRSSPSSGGGDTGRWTMNCFFPLERLDPIRIRWEKPREGLSPLAEQPWVSPGAGAWRSRGVWSFDGEASCEAMSADGVASRLSVDWPALLRAKELPMFFVSMACHFSEYPSQAISRGSIPREKCAPLTQSMSQNASPSTQHSIGADILESRTRDDTCFHSSPHSCSSHRT